MTSDLSNYRKSYEKSELIESHSSKNPIELFEKWFEEVDTHFKDMETNAMTLSTIDLDGTPKNRVVLLKKFSEEGFIFFTNYDSEKGRSIEAHPNVCLSFFWEKAERQVIIKGKASKVADDVSVTYFHSRPRGSQLGALASHQSAVIKSRDVLENRLTQLEKEFEGKTIPKPNNWGGYCVVPQSIEFWQGRSNRLHDRLLYSLIKDKQWNLVRLSP